MMDTTRGSQRKCYEAVLASLALCSVATENASAAEFAYGAGYVAEHSTNINRAPTNERSEWTHSLIGGLAYHDIGPELAANLMVQGQANYYQDNTFDDQTLYFVDAAAIWTISPQLFTWTVEDHHTQALLNVRAADTPSNRVGANIFDTGPDLYLHFGGLNTLVLGGRYGQLYFGDSDADNTRVSAYSRWLYDTNSTTTWSLNYEVLQVDFDHDTTANIDYTRTDTFLRLDMRPLPSHYTLDVGYTDIERDRGASVDGSLLRLTWTRQLTSDSHFGLSAAREHGDAGTQLLATVTDPMATSTPGTPNAEDIVTADVFYAKRLEMFYTYAGADWGVNLQAFDRSFDYLVTPQDRDEQGGRMELSHNPAGLSTTTLFAEMQNAQYLNVTREDDDLTVGLRWRLRASRSISVAIEGSRVQRSSTDPSVEYLDRRVLFGVYYSTGPSYSPARR